LMNVAFFEGLRCVIAGPHEGFVRD
jgi:hypothetical protein